MRKSTWGLGPTFRGPLALHDDQDRQRPISTQWVGLRARKALTSQIDTAISISRVLTRLAMANQSSHQNLRLFNVNLDQIRSAIAIVGKIIMTIQDATSPGPWSGSGGDVILTAILRNERRRAS